MLVLLLLLREWVLEYANDDEPEGGRWGWLGFPLGPWWVAGEKEGWKAPRRCQRSRHVQGFISYYPLNLQPRLSPTALSSFLHLALLNVPC